MRKYLSLILIITVILTSMILLWNVSKSRTFQFFGDIHSRIETNHKVVALTFDDGPTENTDRVLSLLNELNIKATFFVVGADLEKNMIEGKKIVAAGHELGNHSYSHKRMVLKSPDFIREEIEKTDALIKETGYQGEINFRPPYGKRLFLLPYYLKKHNRKTIMWDIEPETDPEVASSSENISKYVLENVKPGSIILLHVMYDSREESVKAIEGIVNGLREQGYAFKTVSELIEN